MFECQKKYKQMTVSDALSVINFASASHIYSASSFFSQL